MHHMLTAGDDPAPPPGLPGPTPQPDDLQRRNATHLACLMHEIANPLNGFAGLCTLLLRPEAEPLTVRQRQLLQLMDDSATSLRRLMADLLDHACGQTGRFSLQLQPVPLVPLLASLVDTLQPLAADAGVQLLADQVPPLQALADPQRLRQCLHNLLGNACKYGRGQVRLVVRAVPPAQPLQPATEVSIDVEDDGPGLAPQALARLGQPFERLGRSDQPGHGLGLAVTRTLVQAMGGRLGLRSAPGAGSCFSLVLPLAAVAA